MALQCPRTPPEGCWYLCLWGLTIALLVPGKYCTLFFRKNFMQNQTKERYDTKLSWCLLEREDQALGIQIAWWVTLQSRKLSLFDCQEQRLAAYVWQMIYVTPWSYAVLFIEKEEIKCDKLNQNTLLLSSVYPKDECSQIRAGQGMDGRMSSPSIISTLPLPWLDLVLQSYELPQSIMITACDHKTPEPSPLLLLRFLMAHIPED